METSKSPPKAQPESGDKQTRSAGEMARDAGLTQSARSSAKSLEHDIKDAARTANRAVREQASQLASDVGRELGETAEGQKMRGVEAIRSFAKAISSAAAELEDQSPQIARSVRDAASKVEGLSDNLSHHSIDQLFKAATDLARQQPMLFIGGSIAAGFALSRFLKSSGGNDRRETTDMHTPTQVH
jgi:hypothetical protein